MSDEELKLPQKVVGGGKCTIEIGGERTLGVLIDDLRDLREDKWRHDNKADIIINITIPYVDKGFSRYVRKIRKKG